MSLLSVPTVLIGGLRRAARLGLPVLLVASAVHGSEHDQMMAKLERWRAPMEASTLGRPMVLQATSTPGGLQGDVFAIVDQPFQRLRASLGRAASWCDVMLLHINNRACKASGSSGREVITLSVVRKHDQPLSAAFELPFDFRVIDSTQPYMQVRLGAADGPLGTSNYRIVFEAVPVDASRSFLHFSYAYDENALAYAATQAYLATFGRSKIGFTVVGTTADGPVDYVRGTQGLVERNAMRYFLAVDAYMASAKDAPSRWHVWYSATEKYPRQLHEIDRATYLELKAADARR